MKKRPPYGSPERELADAIYSKQYKVGEWIREQMIKLVELDSKDARRNLLQDNMNTMLNIVGTLNNIGKGGYIHMCACCGRPEQATYIEPTATRLKDRLLCFYCDFWIERRTTYNAQERKGNMIVVKGIQYGDAGESASHYNFLGFGGARWYICQLTTGKIWTTNNFWHGGHIPEEFRGGMPDNAVFLTKDQYELAIKGREE